MTARVPTMRKQAMLVSMVARNTRTRHQRVGGGISCGSRLTVVVFLAVIAELFRFVWRCGLAMWFGEWVW